MKNPIVKLLINHFLRPLSPLGVILYITNKCNLKCTFCEIGLSPAGEHNPKELTPSQIDQMIDSMDRLGTRHVYITGGEPFLAKSLWHLLEACARHSIRIDGITTNGSLLGRLTEPQIERINRARVRKIIISLDHADRDKHDAMRGLKGLFNDIEGFLKSDGATRIRTNYCLSAVISTQNYEELADLIRWASTVNTIRHINFQPLCADTIFVDYKAESRSKERFLIQAHQIEELKRNIDQSLSVSKALGVSTNLPVLKKWIAQYFLYAGSGTFFFNEVMEGFVCSKPYNYLHINYRGDLLACTHLGPLGNIDDGDLVALWRKGALRYKELLERGSYFSQCRNCFCDFSANYRNSLIYHPLKNRKHILELTSYYLSRYLQRT